MRIQFLRISRIENGFGLLGRNRCWCENVIGIVNAVFDFVSRIEVIGEVQFGAIVPYSRFQFESKLILFRSKTKEIICGCDRGIHEKFAVENMIPSSRCDGISPWHFDTEIIFFVAKSETILSIIPTQEDLVFFAKFVVGFEVEIVEIIA